MKARNLKMTRLEGGEAERASRPFYTRHPRLGFLRDLIRENAGLDFDRTDLNRVFKAVDQYCSEHIPSLDRGGWLSPVILGGAPLKHTPPCIIFAVYAIYADLAGEGVEAVPFLSVPPNMQGATAFLLEPSEQFLLMDRGMSSAPMTDAMFIIPARTPEEWITDTYGVSGFREGVIGVGWHGAAEMLLTAMCSGILLLHPGTGTVLNPLASFTDEEEELFFAEPVLPSKLVRHRERVVDWFGTPFDVLDRNHDCAKRALEACLAI